MIGAFALKDLASGKRVGIIKRTQVAAYHCDAGLADREERPFDRPSLTPVHERKDLDPSRLLQQVYYRHRRELLLVAAGISNPRA